MSPNDKRERALGMLLIMLQQLGASDEFARIATSSDFAYTGRWVTLCEQHRPRKSKRVK